MSNPNYEKALKLGQKSYKNAVAKGDYPYLCALDDILNQEDIKGERYLGLVDIPIDQIVGTKTAGRQHAFSCDFMPLMDEETEFGFKWSNLYEHQIVDGVTDPIIAYEYMNKFYVMEGNKRVSVFKFLGASSIEGYVTRILPQPSNTREYNIYLEFLNFYELTRINYVWFSKEKCFATLLERVGKAADEVWDIEERRLFSSNYSAFQKTFISKGGNKLTITAGDAFLFYLSIYSYRDMADKPTDQIHREIDYIWQEIMELGNSPQAALVMDSSETESGLISRIYNKTTKGLRSKVLNIAFIYDRTAENSSWTYGHELGRSYIQSIFDGQIHTYEYCCQKLQCNITEAINLAIEDGNTVIFTTHQTFLEESLKAAIAHPEIKFLNCSVNRPYTSLRTYYGRMHEAKFLCGMVAAAMCKNDRIAYKADYPIYGACAGINAFALGARMINPQAKVYIHWSSCKDANFDEFIRENDITMISDTDMIRPNSSRRFGVYEIVDGDYKKCITSIWDWGKFYKKIVSEILDGNWSKNTDVKRKKAVNYWWGISSGIIDVIMSKKLDIWQKRLVWMVRKEISEGNLQIFTGEILKQDQTVAVPDGVELTPEEIITMDWLTDNVIGSIPELDELTEEAQKLVRLQRKSTTV